MLSTCRSRMRPSISAGPTRPGSRGRAGKRTTRRPRPADDSRGKASTMSPANLAHRSPLTAHRSPLTAYLLFMPRRPRSRILTPAALGWVLKHAFIGWWNDNVPRLGASLAYYTLFALAPILVIAIGVAGLAFGPDAVRGEVVTQIRGLVGQKGAEAVQAMLQGAARPSASRLATAVGIITAFLGATGAFIELQTALNAIWRVQPRPGANIVSFLSQRLISFGLVIGVGFLLLVSLLVNAALAAFNRYLGNAFPALAVLWEAV